MGIENYWNNEFIPPDVACFGKRYVKKWQQSVKNMRTYNYWRQLFFTAAISRFTWKNLPAGIDPRFLELLLYQRGCFAMTKRCEDLMAFWAGQVIPIKNRDLYYNPNEIDILSPNSYRQRRHCNFWVSKKGSNQHKTNKVVMPPDAVICWDNMTRLPIMSILDLQATRLSEMDVTVDQHSRALRVPFIIQTDEVGKKNAELLFNKVAAGEPAIHANESFVASNMLNVLQTMPKSGYAGSDLLNDQLKIVSAVYTMLGIDNNAAAEKKERVQTAETLANNEQFLIQRNSYIKPRKDFCEKINAMYDLCIEVDWAIPHVSENDSEGGDDAFNF